MMRFILNLESIFLNFYDFFSNLKNQFISKYFDNKVLQLGIYHNNSYSDIYHYDNIYMLIYIWFFNLYNKYSMIYIDDVFLLQSLDSEFYMISYVKNNKILKKIVNPLIKDDYYNEKIVFAIINDHIDMTQDFEEFKEFILQNKTLTVSNIVSMIFSFKHKNKDFINNKNLILKIMLDNNYDELVFKAEDILLINT